MDMYNVKHKGGGSLYTNPSELILESHILINEQFSPQNIPQNGVGGLTATAQFVGNHVRIRWFTVR